MLILNNKKIKDFYNFYESFFSYGFQKNQQILEYQTDYCNKLYKIIINIFEDYWHCNPKTYKEDYYHPELKVTAKECWEKDAKREKDFKEAGYKVYNLWESEVNSNEFIINDFLESLNIKSNLLPEYKGLKTEDIINIISKNRFPYATMMEHWQGDFNFSTMCRNANALGASEVYYIGKKQWNKKGAVGTQYYTKINFIKTYEDLELLKSKYIFIGIDNIANSVPLTNFDWPKNSLMVFGEENKGLTDKTILMCDYIVEIPMMGTVRSLNAGCASAIVMNDYCCKYKK